MNTPRPKTMSLFATFIDSRIAGLLSFHSSRPCFLCRSAIFFRTDHDIAVFRRSSSTFSLACARASPAPANLPPATSSIPLTNLSRGALEEGRGAAFKDKEEVEDAKGFRDEETVDEESTGACFLTEIPFFLLRRGPSSTMSSLGLPLRLRDATESEERGDVFLSASPRRCKEANQSSSPSSSSGAGAGRPSALTSDVRPGERA
jgi:hypothetical protein